MIGRLKRLSERDWDVLDRLFAALVFAAMVLDITLGPGHGPIVLELLVVVWSALTGRHVLAVIAFVAALTTKQHAWLLLPVFAAWRPFGVRRAAVSVVGALVAVAPWFLTAPRAFVHDVLSYNLHLPLRPDALTLYGVWIRQGWHPTFLIVPLVALALIGLVLLRRDVQSAWVLFAATFVLAGFDYVNKLSFFNEWSLPLCLLTAAMVAAQTDPHQGHAGR